MEHRDLDLRNWFSEVYIDEASWDSPVAQRIRKIISVEAKKVSTPPYQDTKGLLSGEEFDHSKHRLYVTPHKGHFFRKCPGTMGAACCNYFVLNLGVQCHMNCSYCYLQAYINSPITRIYSNIEDALQELEETATRFPDSGFRVGTGETIDSLGLDDLTGYSAVLVDWFSRHPKLTCEFKTKSDNVKNFVHLKHAGNVVVSFSINPQEITASEEHGTASLERRLKAARLSADNGFPVAFHIDPMMYRPNWKELYGGLVDQVCDMFSPEEMRWVSVGALRYPPEMKHILRERFGSRSASLTQDMHLSDDGKLRYDLGVRSQMFEFVLQKFRARNPRYPVFLCMETPESWLHTFEATPRKVEGIKNLFEPMPQIS